jgi:two-component system copper resistance phosphate regulon response regulator CusR
MRILIVEDDEVIRQQLWRALLREGYSVMTAKDGEEGLALALTNDLDVVVLDVMMPRRDGFSVCDALRRAKSSLAILMLTAKDEVADRVKGLDTGADDYLVKPFAYEELHARIKALTRRDKVNRSSRIQIADLVIDTANQTASRNGKGLHLTPREFSLLEALARNEGRVLTRDAILERVWDNEESLPNTVNFHITSLRKKVDAPYDLKLIQTVHGFGYTLRVEG